MAEGREDTSKEDLTEEASPHRAEEYRSKGQVGQSKEVSAMAAFLAAGATTYAMTPQIMTKLAEFMREVFRTDLSARLDLGAPHIVRGYLLQAFEIIISIGLPVCGAGFVWGALGSLLQIGTVFSFDPISPDFEKINPIAGLMRMLSMKQAIEALRMIVKALAVFGTAYLMLKSEILNSAQYFGVEANSLLGVYGKVGKAIFFSLTGVLSVFASIDYWYQKREFGKGLRMTKQEAKQEHREREGDPAIRARIRAVQREMARRRMMQAVKSADVIVTNPTHIAIAIVYDKESMAAPRVVAKGADFMAQKIKQIATDAGVPLVENVPLARTLYKSVKINQSVPRALYQAVAEVLAYVYRLKKKGL